ncbi:MAG: hypothetical protein AAB602_01160 [Patescibacteria group bacterium]
MAAETKKWGWLDTLTIVKEIVDLLGLAAFVKVFFSDKNAKKVEAWIAADYRPKVAKLIANLQPNRGNNLLRRLREADKIGEEDRLSRCLGKFVDDDDADDIFKLLDSVNDDQFNAIMMVLEDDRVHQFLVRAKNWFKTNKDEFDAAVRVRIETWLKDIEKWEREQLAKAAARTPNPTAVKLLENPLRIFPWFFRRHKGPALYLALIPAFLLGATLYSVIKNSRFLSRLRIGEWIGEWMPLAWTFFGVAWPLFAILVILGVLWLCGRIAHRKAASP